MRLRLLASIGILGCTQLAYCQSPPRPQVDLSGVESELRIHVITPPQTNCASQDYKGSFGYARYVSKCEAVIHITVVFGNVDDVKQFDLAPGKDHSILLDIVEYANRKGSSWYLCPKNYYAVDATGHPFKRPVNVYLCRKSDS